MSLVGDLLRQIDELERENRKITKEYENFAIRFVNSIGYLTRKQYEQIMRENESKQIVRD